MLVNDGPELLGIFPLISYKTNLRFFPVTSIEFMENNESSRSNVICGKRRQEVVRALFSHLLQEKASWDVMRLRRIPFSSENLSLLQEESKNLGLPVYVRPSWNSPFIRINTGWEEFYKGTSQRFKKRMRNNENKLKQLEKISIEHITHAGQNDRFLDDIFAVGKNCWKWEMGKSIASSEENIKFYSLLAATTCELGWLSIWIMKYDKKPIAFEYHLRYGDHVHGLRSEFDEEFRAYSPGAVLDCHIVRNLFQEGFSRYDLGGSADEYKMHWTSEVQSHQDVYIFNRGAYPALVRFFEGKLIPFLKRFRHSPSRN